MKITPELQAALQLRRRWQTLLGVGSKAYVEADAAVYALDPAYAHRVH